MEPGLSSRTHCVCQRSSSSLQVFELINQLENRKIVGSQLVDFIRIDGWSYEGSWSNSLIGSDLRFDLSPSNETIILVELLNQFQWARGGDFLECIDQIVSISLDRDTAWNAVMDTSRNLSDFLH